MHASITAANEQARPPWLGAGAGAQAGAVASLDALHKNEYVFSDVGGVVGDSLKAVRDEEQVATT